MESLKLFRRVSFIQSKQNCGNTWCEHNLMQIILSLRHTFQVPNLNLPSLCIVIAQQTLLRQVSPSLHQQIKFSWPGWIYSGSVELCFSPAGHLVITRKLEVINIYECYEGPWLSSITIHSFFNDNISGVTSCCSFESWLVLSFYLPVPSLADCRHHKWIAFQNNQNVQDLRKFKSLSQLRWVCIIALLLENMLIELRFWRLEQLSLVSGCSGSARHA